MTDEMSRVVIAREPLFGKSVFEFRDRN